MANTVTTSALGLVFWAGATRLYSPRQVGEDAALISAMVLLSSVSQLNLNMGIARLLPQVARRRRRAVLSTYALTSVVAIGLTSCFLAVVPRLADGLAFLGDDRLLQVALVGAVVVWNVFSLQDAVLASARWAVAVPIENGVFGVVKVGLMVALVREFNGHGIFAAWLLGMALVVVPVNALIFGRVLRLTSPTLQRRPPTVLPLENRGMVARYLATDYAAAVLSQGSTALLPMLVIATLGRSASAYFYISFLVTAAVVALAQSLSTSLIVEAAHDEANLAALTAHSVRRYIRFVLPGVVLMVLAAPWLLRPFGVDYAARAGTLLRLLLAGTVPQAVVCLYLAVERVQARVHRVLTVEALTVVAMTFGAIAGMRWFGLEGVGIAWLSSQTVLAVVVLPRLRKTIARNR